MAKNGFGRAGRHELTAALKWQKRQRKEVKQPNGKGNEWKAVLLAKTAGRFF